MITDIIYLLFLSYIRQTINKCIIYDFQDLNYAGSFRVCKLGYHINKYETISNLKWMVLFSYKNWALNS